MMRSLFAGVSGLSNQQLKMDVIGNNIANISTIGFKSSRINFEEEFSQVLRSAQQTASGGSQNAILIGLGVGPGSIDRNFSQGILQATGKQLDLGIDGDGFFVVSNGQAQLYTRAGNFHFDGNGRLVTSSGAFVQGWMADLNGAVSDTAPVGNIIFDATVLSPAAATTNVSIVGNLDATATPVRQEWTSTKTLTLASDGSNAIGTTQLNDLSQTTTPLLVGDTIIINGTNPDGSAVSATFTYGVANDGTTVNDLLAVINNTFTDVTATIANGKIVLTDDNYGASQTSLVLAEGTSNGGVIALPSFVSTAEGNSPQTTATVEVFDSLGTKHTLNLTFTKTPNAREWSWAVTMGGSEVISEGSTGTLTFAADGSLETINYDQGQSALVFDPANGANEISLNLDFENSTGFSGITQYAGESSINMPFQDGQAIGKLSSFSIDESGKIFGSFTNGRTRMIAQLALAAVNNPQGLLHVGNNLYQLSASSGLPAVGKAGTDIGSSIVSGTLEASNVDLAQEFAEMIIAQRAFQANARVITVSDQFLSEVTQLKR